MRLMSKSDGNRPVSPLFLSISGSIRAIAARSVYKTCSLTMNRIR
ncbi:hypothetical protein C7382_11216 [Porphyromonas loveana]|uniref:Uncharacterized protein n=1 Tax=Porphyromonas loveana TaxID=1884669 RepID=A0A2U1F908_9PORP|nr:hypothetical protein C7382_11216 [Porphyromonas loveana]